MPAKKKTTNNSNNPQEMTPDQRVAFHQGALTTLVGERNELIRLLQTTEQLMNAHIEELKKLGVTFPEGKQ